MAVVCENHKQIIILYAYGKNSFCLGKPLHGVSTLIIAYATLIIACDDTTHHSLACRSHLTTQSMLFDIILFLAAMQSEMWMKLLTFGENSLKTFSEVNGPFR